MRLIPKRETLTLPNAEGNGETWDYFTIYDDQMNIIERSDKYTADQTIRFLYDDLMYVALPSKEVLITWDSIMEKFSKPD
jgi:hypothetical protein